MAGITLLATLGEPPSTTLEGMDLASRMPQVERLPSETEMQLYAMKQADKEGVSFHEIFVTLDGESDWRNIQSEVVRDGKQEDSHGVCQIHAPSHPELTKEQLYDPYFCIEWTAQQFKEGNASQWTAYRNSFM